MRYDDDEFMLLLLLFIEWENIKSTYIKSLQLTHTKNNNKNNEKNRNFFLIFNWAKKKILKIWIVNYFLLKKIYK